MFRVALCQDRLNVAPSQTLSMRLRIIRPVPLDATRTPLPSLFTANLRDGIDQRNQLRYVVGIGARQRGRQRDAVGVGENMMLRSGFAAICGIRAGLRPPKTARTELLSTTARDQSICSASSNFWSATRWILSHTPAACQSRSRRQHVIPDPQPISFGRNSQGIPVLSTNRMPVSTWRLLSGFRPGCRRRRFLGGGKSGSISAHSSSSKTGRAMAASPCTARQYTQSK